MSFEGRNALVTGGSRGIGRAVATELLARGANVVITGRNRAALSDAVAEMTARGYPGTVIAECGDATDEADRVRAVARTVTEFGSVDILVNNAGCNPVYGRLVDHDLDIVRSMFDLNVLAAIGFVREAERAGMGERGGAVVNVASVAGLRSTGIMPAYGASKAALIRLTEELAWQMGPRVRVNAVAPGIVRTAFSEVLYSDETRAAAPYPLRRLGTVEDVAHAVVFLASDQAAWITGETLRVDGGLLATGGIRTAARG